MAQGRYNEPFFWHRLVNVGWATDGVVIVQVTAPEIKSYQVSVLDPEDWFDDNFGGATITYEDYREAFVLNLGTSTGVGEVVTETALDIWHWDDWIGVDPIGTDISEDIALKTAALGYGPTLHFTGQGVKTNPQTLPPETSTLGDIKEHTHPNGSSVSYRNEYTLVTNDGAFNYSNMETWYWHRVTTLPAQTAAILRRSFLVNFAKDFTKLAELQDFTMALDSPLQWSIKGYAARTEFTISDSIVTPIGAVPPKFSDAGSVAGSHSGTIKRFNSSGFV